MSDFKYTGIEGYVAELKTTVRECIDCSCLVPGGPTRCKRCAREHDNGVHLEPDWLGYYKKHLQSAEDRLNSLAFEKVELAEEVEKWKEASGLQVGGDPDGVTPEAARDYWKDIERRLSIAIGALAQLLEDKPMLGARKAGSTTLGNLFVEIGGRHG